MLINMGGADFAGAFRERRLADIRNGREIECHTYHAGKSIQELCQEWQLPVDPRKTRVNGRAVETDYRVREGDCLLFTLE